MAAEVVTMKEAWMAEVGARSPACLVPVVHACLLPLFSNILAPEGWIKIIECPTNEMNADYLTKGLPRVIFEAN